MTNPGVGTLTRTESITMVDIRDVAARIHADLCTIRVRHPALLKADRQANIFADLVLLMYRGFIDRIDFNFTFASGALHPGSVRYDLTRQWSGWSNDESGGLGTFDSTGLRFTVMIHHTATWKSLSVQERANVERDLLANWGPMQAPTGNGNWVSDRQYGHGSFGAERFVFRAD